MENPNTWNGTQKIIDASLYLNGEMSMSNVLTKLQDKKILFVWGNHSFLSLEQDLQHTMEELFASEVIGYSYATTIYNRLKELKVLFDFCEACDFVSYGNHVHCPSCDSPPSQHELRDYSMMWHEGEIYCTKCHARVRSYDAG